MLKKALFLLAIAALLLGCAQVKKEEKGVQVPNPAAVYCVKLGYNYTIVNSAKGQYGVCHFPDGSSCDAWKFYRGECGRRFTYCETHGGNLSCGGNGSCMCTLPNGEKKSEIKLFEENVLKKS